MPIYNLLFEILLEIPRYSLFNDTIKIFRDRRDSNRVLFINLNPVISQIKFEHTLVNECQIRNHIEHDRFFALKSLREYLCFRMFDFTLRITSNFEICIFPKKVKFIKFFDSQLINSSLRTFNTFTVTFAYRAIADLYINGKIITSTATVLYSITSNNVVQMNISLIFLCVNCRIY